MSESSTGEVWQSIPEWEGLYEFSSLGRVKSLRKGLTMKPWPDQDGYARLHLRTTDGRRVYRRVHLLIATAFYGPPGPGMEVRHLDGDKNNNVASNLQYGTHSENAQDMVEHGVHNQASKTHCRNGHEYTPENTWIITTDKGEERRCRTCGKEANARARAKRKTRPEKCSEPGCNRPLLARELCGPHYQQLRKRGLPDLS